MARARSAVFEDYISCVAETRAVTSEWAFIVDREQKRDLELRLLGLYAQSRSLLREYNDICLQEARARPRF